MKSFLKVSLYSFVVFLFGLLFISTVHASEKDASVSRELDKAKVEVTVTDDQSGETTILESKDIKII